jgi:hypothetical protein
MIFRYSNSEAAENGVGHLAAQRYFSASFEKSGQASCGLILSHEQNVGFDPRLARKDPGQGDTNLEQFPTLPAAFCRRS